MESIAKRIMKNITEDNITEGMKMWTFDQDFMGTGKSIKLPFDNEARWIFINPDDGFIVPVTQEVLNNKLEDAEEDDDEDWQRACKAIDKLKAGQVYDAREVSDGYYFCIK